MSNRVMFIWSMDGNMYRVRGYLRGCERPFIAVVRGVCM